MSAAYLYQQSDPPPPPPGAACWICLDEGPSETEGDPLLRNCACRGTSAGYAHVSCVSEHARRESEKAFAKSQGMGDDDWASIKPWTTCRNCGQEYVGSMALAMADKFVESNTHLPEFSYLRYHALLHLASTRFNCGDVDGAQNQYEHLLGVFESVNAMSSMFGQEVDTRDKEAEILEALAPVYVKKATARGVPINVQKAYVKKAYESAKKAHTIFVDMFGPASQRAITSEMVLLPLQKTMERASGKQPTRQDTKAAVRIARNTYDTFKRDFGEGSKAGLTAVLPLVQALEADGKLSEAAKLLEETLGTSRTVLGPTHPDTQLMEVALKELKSKQRAGKDTSSSSSSTAVNAILVGIPSKPGLNGRRVQVLRPTKDGKYIVLLESNGGGNKKPAKFKAVAANLVFSSGTPVVVRDLVSASHLNGRGATIESYDEDKGRYAVAVGDDFCGLLKPENLNVVFS